MFSLRTLGDLVSFAAVFWMSRNARDIQKTAARETIGDYEEGKTGVSVKPGKGPEHPPDGPDPSGAPLITKTRPK